MRLINFNNPLSKNANSPLFGSPCKAKQKKIVTQKLNQPVPIKKMRTKPTVDTQSKPSFSATHKVKIKLLIVNPSPRKTSTKPYPMSF